jgi:hypothetical protein
MAAAMGVHLTIDLLEANQSARNTSTTVVVGPANDGSEERRKQASRRSQPAGCT